MPMPLKQTELQNKTSQMTEDEQIAMMLFDSSKGAVSYEVAGQEVKLNIPIVRKCLVRGNGEVSDADIYQFLQICRFNQLNPFLNEAYLVKYKDNVQMITSKEALMKRAEVNPTFKGVEAGVIVARGNEILEMEGAFYMPTDTLVGGWARVMRTDRDKPIISRVNLREYDKSQSTWNDKKGTMIRKVAIMQALREAFPVQLGALYTAEESFVEDVPYEDVSSKAAMATDLPEAPAMVLPETAENPNKRTNPGF